MGFACRRSGQESLVDLRQLLDRQSDVRFSDEGEHDSAGQEFWFQVRAFG